MRAAPRGGAAAPGAAASGAAAGSDSAGGGICTATASASMLDGGKPVDGSGLAAPAQKPRVAAVRATAVPPASEAKTNTPLLPVRPAPPASAAAVR